MPLLVITLGISRIPSDFYLDALFNQEVKCLQILTRSVCSTAQGHASFTIEFDNASPGKVTIKDHVSKFTPDHHRPRSKKSGAGSAAAGGRDLSTLQAAMMASESKVADWLAQNDPTVVRSESTEDDSKSIKSDVPVHLKRLKGEEVAPSCCFVIIRSV